MISGIGVAAVKKIIIKSAAALEAVGKITKVAMDKTGTITKGLCEV